MIHPKKRSEGKNYHFKNNKSYPLFWLQKSVISSASGNSDYGTNLEGEITNLSTDAKLINSPGILSLKGSFPKEDILGINLKLTINHHLNQPHEKLQLNIDQFPIHHLKLSESKKLTLNLTKAQGNSAFKVVKTDNIFDISINNKIKETQYLVRSPSRSFERIITNIVNDIPTINLDAHSQGTWQDLKFKISSNLGKEIATGIKSQVKNEIDKKKKEIKKKVYEKIEKPKKELLSKYKSIQQEFNRKINSNLTSAKKSIGQLKNQALKLAQSKKTQDKVKTKAKEEAKKILNKLKKFSF